MPDRVLAEFADEHAIVAAIERLRGDGERRLEAYMPFPSHLVEHALARGRSTLPFVICAFGIAGAAGAYFLQWLLVAYLYPLNAGGRPPHFPLAFVIITFEMGVLVAALSAFVGTLVAGRLVRLTDSVQGIPGFESVTRDAFWLEIHPADHAHVLAVVRECGARRVEVLP